MNRTRLWPAPLAALLLAACGGTTQGDLLTVPFQAGGVQRSTAVDAPFTFTTPTQPSGVGGWMVTLTQALIATGPFYFNLVAPPTQGFRDGTVVMEVASQVVVDPLDPTLYAVQGGASGLTGLGEALYVEIDLFPPDGTCVAPSSPVCGTEADTLTNGDPGDGNSFGQLSQAYIAGTAVQGSGTPIPFAGWVTINQSYATSTNQFLPYVQRIAGASVALDFQSSSQTLQFRVDPTHWFDSVDFSVFEATPLDTTSYSLVHGNYTWTNESEFHTQLLQGIWSTSGVYLFSLVNSPK